MVESGSHICSIVLVFSVGGLVAAATILTKIIVQLVFPPAYRGRNGHGDNCTYSWWPHGNNYLLIYISG